MEEYSNEEEYRKARDFGNSTILEDSEGIEKLRELEDLKYFQIVHRI